MGIQTTTDMRGVKTLHHLAKTVSELYQLSLVFKYFIIVSLDSQAVEGQGNKRVLIFLISFSEAEI